MKMNYEAKNTTENTQEKVAWILQRFDIVFVISYLLKGVKLFLRNHAIDFKLVLVSA